MGKPATPGREIDGEVRRLHIRPVIGQGAPAARGPFSRREAAALAAFFAALAFPVSAGAAEQAFRPWRGAPGSIFSLPALDAATVSLDAQRGRIVVLHFFATWCEPCREELPALARFSAKADAAAVSVLAISTAEPEARVRRFLNARPVNFPVLLDEARSVSKAWSVDILPSTIVLDARLEPRLMVEGDFAWDGLTPGELISRLGADEAPPADDKDGGGPS